MRARAILLPLLAALGTAACSELPTDVVEQVELHATEGLRAEVASYARAAVFREAIDVVIASEGQQTLWRRTAPLRAHAATARAAQARGDTEARIAAERAHNDARVRFMADALGDVRIDDVRHQVRDAVDDAWARTDMLHSEGHDVTRATVLLDDARELLHRPAAGPLTVLAATLDAADILDRLDLLLRAVERPQSLEELFATSIADVRQTAGSRAARALLAEHQTLVREAQQALAGGGRIRAHDRLQQVRTRQVAIVAQRIGREGVGRHVRDVIAAEQTLPFPREERRRVIARDYIDQARSALARGDVERALDRSAVAAEIVNALATEDR